MAQLLSNLPNRALLKFGKHQVTDETAQPIIWMVASKNHNGYPANSVTLITEKIIDLREYDSKESGDDATAYGNPNYAWSNLHQWLNSSAGAEQWYVKAHPNDSAPTGGYHAPSYWERAGFLYNFTEAERAMLLPTTINAQRAAGDNYTTIVAKVFLPSIKEITGTFLYEDGSYQFSCFTSGNVTCPITEQAFNNSYAQTPTELTSNCSYFTRSVKDYQYVYAISNTGGSISARPNDETTGTRPCINLAGTTKISDTPDADGCYTILTNAIPSISGTNSDLGEQYEGFTQTYKVTDGDNDTITVTEYIDNVAIRAYVATPEVENTFSVEGATWVKLSNGSHTIKILASDSFSESIRTYTFVKKVTAMVVQRTTPMVSSTMPKSIIVSVVKNIPTEAIFKVESCNNGFDDSPAWEDITFEVVNGEIHDFTNTSKTATQWGVNIRVTVDRNGAEGACYITEIGGNFE